MGLVKIVCPKTTVFGQAILLCSKTRVLVLGTGGFIEHGFWAPGIKNIGETDVKFLVLFTFLAFSWVKII